MGANGTVIFTGGAAGAGCTSAAGCIHPAARIAAVTMARRRIWRVSGMIYSFERLL